jgi:hypothetical protein
VIYLRMALQTAIIVAIITLLGTIITALGKEILNRVWPQRKEEKE